MLAACVFFRAIVFSVRTSDEVHERRFDFLGIPIISEWKGRDLVARICWKEKQKKAAKGCRTMRERQSPRLDAGRRMEQREKRS